MLQEEQGAAIWLPSADERSLPPEMLAGLRMAYRLEALGAFQPIQPVLHAKEGILGRAQGLCRRSSRADADEALKAPLRLPLNFDVCPRALPELLNGSSALQKQWALSDVCARAARQSPGLLLMPWLGCLPASKGPVKRHVGMVKAAPS